MCRVIAISNQKGGVGKTTTTVNLGKGKKVLLIDADPQGSLTASLGYVEPDEIGTTLATIMMAIINEKEFEITDGILHHKENVDLLPANIELSALEVTMGNVMSRELIMKEYIEAVRTEYDYILIDCMPSLGLMTINALVAADSVLIPVQAAYLPVKGLQQLIHTIAMVKKRLNRQLVFEGILLTMVDFRTNYAKDVAGKVREAYGEKIEIFDTVIPMSVKAAETSAEGVSIFSHCLNGKVAKAYETIAEEVLRNEELKMPSIDELLGVSGEESATDIEISRIHSFANHPFKVLDDDKMDDLVESIKQNGVLTPVLVRPDKNNNYEMISGHRRMHAAIKAGLETIPAIVRDMDDDDAVVVMVDANIQREELLPSEKAFAYKMKMDAMKRQAGRPSKNNSTQVGRNFETAELIGKETGESKNTIRRFIRLTELIPELLDYVDKKRLPFTVAVDISYIDKEIQTWLFEYIKENGTVKAVQVAALRTALEVGPMTQAKMISILVNSQPGRKQEQKITLSEKKLRNFFSDKYTVEDMESVILELLDQWKRGEITV